MVSSTARLLGLRLLLAGVCGGVATSWPLDAARAQSRARATAPDLAPIADGLRGTIAPRADPGSEPSDDAGGDPVDTAAPQVADDGRLGEAAPSDMLRPADGRLEVDSGRVATGEGAVAADPTAFAEPVTLRRDRPSVYGPYQPVGVRMGSFVIFPAAEVGGAASTNIFRSTQAPRADIWSELRAGLLAQSRWRQHAVDLELRGGQSFHDRYASEDDRTFEARARARIDITRRTSVTADAATSFAQEGRGSINLPQSATTRPDVRTERVGVALEHAWNRVGMQLRTSLTNVTYSTETSIDPLSGLPVVAGGRERNYVQREIGGRLSYALRPGLAVFGDAASIDRSYVVLSSRNSTGQRLRAGLAFTLAGKWRGEVSVGHAVQRPDHETLSDVSGFIYDADLVWHPTGLTQVRLTAQSDIAETTLPGASGALTRKAGIEMRHALRRHLILIAGASYSVAQYAGAALSEAETKTRLGTEFFVSRETALTAGWEHTSFHSTTAGRDWDDDTYRVGVRVRR
jgi:hypothetical protein